MPSSGTFGIRWLSVCGQCYPWVVHVITLCCLTFELLGGSDIVILTKRKLFVFIWNLLSACIHVLLCLFCSERLYSQLDVQRCRETFYLQKGARPQLVKVFRFFVFLDNKAVLWTVCPSGLWQLLRLAWSVWLDGVTGTWTRFCLIIKHHVAVVAAKQKAFCFTAVALFLLLFTILVPFFLALLQFFGFHSDSWAPYIYTWSKTARF